MARKTLRRQVIVLGIACTTVTALFAALFAAAARFVGVRPFDAVVASLIVSLPLSWIITSRGMRNVHRSLQALTDGVQSFRDDDYSLRLAEIRDDEIGEMIRLYNDVRETLRQERNEIYQKELLLDTVLQGSPMAVMLISATDRILYSNRPARELLARGGALDGRHFAAVAMELAPSLREALAATNDTLFTLATDATDETFSVSKRAFHLNMQRHTLIVIKRLTPELRRQEVEIWKKAIRIMNHELNNSLAPISSLVHSARHVANHPELSGRLDEIYSMLEERVGFLRQFLEGYATFARLPQPLKREVQWEELLRGVRAVCEFKLEGGVPSSAGWFDPSQMQQVLINLIKNGHEAGSDEVIVSIQSSLLSGTVIRVCDRGRGMSEEEMRQALVPFYSSKRTGTGLGVPLCSEIIEAHGGRMRIQAREGGGVEVTCWLPPAEG